MLRKKERKYCGHTWGQMDIVLDTLCELEDSLLITHKEQEAMDMAIQCVTEIMNRMKDGRKIMWDD